MTARTGGVIDPADKPLEFEDYAAGISKPIGVSEARAANIRVAKVDPIDLGWADGNLWSHAKVESSACCCGKSSCGCVDIHTRKTGIDSHPVGPY